MAVSKLEDDQPVVYADETRLEGKLLVLHDDL